jgi:hypothetical protein
MALPMRNNFGVTPIPLIGRPRHSERSVSPRPNVHPGDTLLPTGPPAEAAPSSAELFSHRIPRNTVDAVEMRPIDLATIDRVEAAAGGEGSWIEGLRHMTPKLLVAGRLHGLRPDRGPRHRIARH